MEIVSEPDIRSPKEAAEYMKKLRSIVRYLGVCDGNLEQGSFRCDANVSIRPVGQKEFGTRAEVKNINSFRYVEKAIEYEIERQIEAHEAGAAQIPVRATCQAAPPKMGTVPISPKSIEHEHVADDGRERLRAGG